MTNSEGENDDNTLMRELRIKDEKFTKEIYDAVLNPTDMLNVLLKRHYSIMKQNQKACFILAKGRRYLLL